MAGEYDLIDSLIDALNDGVDGVTFERDVLETNRPDDWAAVELTGEGDSDWADGNQVDQTLEIDIWVCVTNRGSRIKRKVQAALKRWCATEDAGWKLASRNYIYDLDKVIWRWTVNVWAPLAEDEDDPTEDPLGPLPFTDPEEDPEEYMDPEWPEMDPE
jgi:hypothetical protein